MDSTQPDNMGKTSAPLRLAVVAVAALSALLGSKCIAYDEGFDQPLPGGLQGSSGAGGGFPGAAVVCSKPDVARIKVIDTSYQIECGCAETTGKTCTVVAGTRVQWVFGDSEEHNVTSKASIFSDSVDLLGGKHEHRFDKAGTYGYGCSLHASMRGYSIVVRDASDTSVD